MKIIAENLITGITASSESTSFPASHLLDDHPKRVWRGNGVSQAKLTCSISAGSTGLAIYNTNATRTVCNLSDPCEYVFVEVDPIDVELVTAAIATTTYVVEGNGSSTVWVDFAEAIPASIVADVTMTNEDGEIIEAGVAIGGIVQTFRDPAPGMAEGEVDYSTEVLMDNGSFFTHAKDTVRTFDGAVLMARDPDFYNFMAISRTMKKSPFAWRVTDMSGDEWTVYARFNGKPRGAHITKDWSQVQFSIIEVI